MCILLWLMVVVGMIIRLMLLIVIGLSILFVGFGRLNRFFVILLLFVVMV